MDNLGDELALRRHVPGEPTKDSVFVPKEVFDEGIGLFKDKDFFAGRHECFGQGFGKGVGRAKCEYRYIRPSLL